MPRDVTTLDPITGALDAADHADRVAWIRSLGRADQLALYALAEGTTLGVDALVGAEGEVVRHLGKNGLLFFNHFEKRFVRQGDGVVGYNHNDFGWLGPVARRVTGPGHYTAYDPPSEAGEVWIDYRKLPVVQHPEFPPLRSNETGLPALVFGNMVDVLRRVSVHVTIGDAFKTFERPDRPGLLARIGSWLPTAPFVLCREVA